MKKSGKHQSWFMSYINPSWWPLNLQASFPEALSRSIESPWSFLPPILVDFESMDDKNVGNLVFFLVLIYFIERGNL